MYPSLLRDLRLTILYIFDSTCLFSGGWFYGLLATFVMVSGLVLLYTATTTFYAYFWFFSEGGGGTYDLVTCLADAGSPGLVWLLLATLANQYVHRSPSSFGFSTPSSLLPTGPLCD